MKKTLLSLLTAIVMSVVSFAGTPLKRNCGTMDNLQRLKVEDPTLESRMLQIEAQTSAYLQAHKYDQNTTNAVITIPVVFHVVYNTTAQNISDAQCQAQLDQLNLDFARLNADRTSTPSVWSTIAVNTNIQFCMAQRDPSGNATTGIEGRQTTTTSFSTNDNVKRTANGGMDAWSASSYLNIWSCNLGSGLLGYAQFPGGSAATDGVVLLYSSVGSVARPGTATPYHLGRTATHEVGHWVNLYHIWGDDNGACSGSDNVGDTPNQAGENYGCPTYPKTDGCTSSSPGVMFMNYMDYTDDGCMNMFTAGQSTRMNSIFATGGSRAAMLNSLGCVAPLTTCGTPSGLSASVSTTTANLSWTAVSGAANYTVQYQLSGGTTWTTLTATTNSTSLSGLTSSTTYNWQVQANCSSGAGLIASSSFTTSAVVTCGVPSGLSSSSITSSSATISWSAASGATSYSIQYKTSAATTWTTVSTSGTSLALSSLTASTTYLFQVQTVCTSGTSAFSSQASFTTSAVSTGCTDIYEPNNSSSAASVISTNVDLTGLISSSTDNDYYKFTTTSPNTNIKITLTNLPADYDIRLYNSSLTQLAISQNGSTTSETITRNTTSAGTYYIRVYGYNGAYSTTKCYSLRVNVGSSTFRTIDSPQEVNPVAVNQFVVYPNPAHESINAEFNSPTAEIIHVRIFDIMGKSAIVNEMSVNEGNNKFNFDLSELNKGIYFIELSNSTERIVKKFILEK